MATTNRTGSKTNQTGAPGEQSTGTPALAEPRFKHCRQGCSFTPQQAILRDDLPPAIRTAHLTWRWMFSDDVECGVVVPGCTTAWSGAPADAVSQTGA
jgi:hypothetical protein